MNRYSKSGIYDNWGKLVRATLLREELRMIGQKTPSDTSSSSSPATTSPFCPTLSRRRLQFPTSFLVGDSFTYSQILRATDYLSSSNLIKNGHTGDLFHGELEDGMQIVVKKVDLSLSFEKEAFLITELKIFGKASHSRFVPIVGHCLEDVRHKFLVYKYMPNKDLSSSLLRNDNDLESLDWITRLKIAIGVAEALCYLHHDCGAPLIHRDIQASSILLDDNFEVRLGSLGEVCVAEESISIFRKAAEQETMGITTLSYDVYCLGKVLLELVTGHLGFSAAKESTMKYFMPNILPFIDIDDKELVKEIVDPTLAIDEDILTQVWAMSIVAKACLNPMPSKRPLIMHVLKALEDPLKMANQDTSEMF